MGRDELAGVLQVVGERHVPQRPFESGPDAVGAAHHVQRPAGTRRQRRPGHPRTGRGDEQGRPAGVLHLQQLHRGRHIVHSGHRHGVGQRAQRGGQRRLVPGIDREQRRDATQQPGDPIARGQQGTGAVLAPQPERQRLLAGTPLGGLHLGLPFGVGQLLLARLRHLGRAQRRGVPLDQLGVLLVEPLGLGARGLVRGLGNLRPFPGLGGGDLVPLDLLLGGRGPAARGVDLPGQLGQALAPLGDRLDRLDERLLRLGELPFQALPAGHRLGQVRLVGLQRVAQRGLLGAYLVRLGGQLVGVAAGALVVARRGQVTQPLAGQLLGRAEPFLQRGQLVPGLLRLREDRRVQRVRGLQLGQPGLDGTQVPLDLFAPGAQGRLVGDLLVQGLPQGRQVVGEQPEPGVAQV